MACANTPTIGTSTLDAAPKLDPESRVWIERLRSDGADFARAVEELRTMLVKAARFELRRRHAAVGQPHAHDGEDLAQQSADDALMAILGKLDEFRGESRFTTWAYKFVLYDAAVKARRRAWQERELRLEQEPWDVLADDRQAPDQDAEMRELLAALRQAIDVDLTAHQRDVLVAIALNDVPIDVLAQRTGSTRGALYKTLHDARRKLRASLAAQGFAFRQQGREEKP
ncbi:MAG: RNA polymerase sigma factor [Solirubrobacteraceae bacterium]